MYEGIFEDVELVKETLASHGHKSVDETLVFELLEDLKVREHVVKVLLGTRLRANTVTLDKSLSPNRTVQLDAETSVAGTGDSSYFSNTVEDSSSSDDLEVLEDHVPNVPVSEPVDLTMDDNQSTCSSSGKFIVEDMKETIKEEGKEQLVDLTAEILEAQLPPCQNEESKDAGEPKSVEADGNNSSTESESEIDDYYRMSDEPEGSEGFVESDDKASPPLSPRLNFDIPANNDASNPEAGENRMEEMLEENNNDPNNNLEDIEVLEQNNSAAATTQNLNIEKEFIEERSPSPKPGCSKDSYYADTDVCMMESGPAEYGKEKIISGMGPDIPKPFGDNNPLADNRLGHLYRDIDRDLYFIKEILPRIPTAKILAKLEENKDAVNRAEIAIWELLPDEKPKPVFHPKRKQEEDNCPAPIKKCIQDHSAPKEDQEIPLGGEFPKIDAQTSNLKGGIIKPAILQVSEIKKNILKPPKLEFVNCRPVSPPPEAVNPKNKSTITLKPSKLEHLNTQSTQNTAAGESKMLNSMLDIPADNNFQTFFKENEMAPFDVNRFAAIPRKPKQSVQLVRTELEKRLKDPTEFTVNNCAAIQKLRMPIQMPPAPKADRVSGHLHIYQPVTKEGKYPAKLNCVQNTNRILKPPSLIRAPEQMGKEAKDFRELVNEKGQTRGFFDGRFSEEEGVTLQKLGRALHQVSNLRQETQESYRKMLDLPYNPNPYTTQRSELNVEIHVPKSSAVSVPADPNRLNIVKREAQVPGAYGTSNEFNRQILQRVGNIQLENQHSLGNRIINNAQIPRPEREKRPQLQPQPQPPPQPLLQSQPQPRPLLIQQQLNIAAFDVLGASGPAQAEPVRFERQDFPPPKELFNPLINMFPDVDPNYIAELCISAKARNQGLESLVERLLIDGMMHPRIINPEPEPLDLNPDTQYENLQGIFPDAHPEYLRGIAEQYYNNPDAMKDFVQAKLEKPDYPTMADYLKKIKITEQIKQYTVDFSAQNFLQIFPKPFTHFENPKRETQYNVIAFEFLKCHFRSNKINTIQRAYRYSKYPFNTTLAAKTLEVIGPDMKSKRPDKPLPTEDIPLLQEFAFIRHKAKIKEYIAAEKLKQKQEFKKLKENNELLECQCCYDGECMPSKCHTCSEGHIFCKSCIKMGSETKIGEGQTNFPCFVDCKGEFALPVLQKVLEPTMFSILLRKRQEEEVKAAGLEGLVSCPFCHFASIPPPEDKVFKCLNPECMKESCRLCKELNHVPLRCDEVVKGEEARRYLEEKMTEALVRKCYRCSRPFFKDEGCNKMTCPCGAMTCYICGEPVKDYRHFNGQGSDRTDLCPLWSDNKVLNAQTVRIVAEAAEKEILKKNPNLKLDTKALMPSLPQASRGPHQDIANAHVLPVQARRV